MGESVGYINVDFLVWYCSCTKGSQWACWMKGTQNLPSCFSATSGLFQNWNFKNKWLDEIALAKYTGSCRGSSTEIPLDISIEEKRGQDSQIKVHTLPLPRSYTTFPKAKSVGHSPHSYSGMSGMSRKWSMYIKLFPGDTATFTPGGHVSCHLEWQLGWRWGVENHQALAFNTPGFKIQACHSPAVVTWALFALFRPPQDRDGNKHYYHIGLWEESMT